MGFLSCNEALDQASAEEVPKFSGELHGDAAKGFSGNICHQSLPVGMRAQM